MSRIARINTCGHPERAHEAHGMCNACNKRAYKQSIKALALAGIVANPCSNHPDRPVEARGLCKNCYDQKYGKSHNRKRYNVTPTIFKAMLNAQKACCAICKRPLTRGKTTHIDHDHQCCDGPKSCGNCIRDLLCSQCNNGLGQFKDDPDTLRAAADYIERHKQSRDIKNRETPVGEISTTRASRQTNHHPLKM